jgi:hypothetical protein
MPRLGRFLFGKWLVSHDVTPLVEQDGRVSFSVAYTDSYGATHRRRASLGQRDLEVEDEITGDFKFAVLRWRLLPGDWVREENRLASERGTIEINCSGVIGRISLVEGWESIHYGRKTPVPVVEVEVAQPCVLRSNYAAAL